MKDVECLDPKSVSRWKTKVKIFCIGIVGIQGDVADRGEDVLRWLSGNRIDGYGCVLESDIGLESNLAHCTSTEILSDGVQFLTLEPMSSFSVEDCESLGGSAYTAVLEFL